MRIRLLSLPLSTLSLLHLPTPRPRARCDALLDEVSNQLQFK